MEEMQALLGGKAPWDSHDVNNAKPFAKFGWHVDNHTEIDTKRGPYLHWTAVVQCSPGRTSMAVAGAGEHQYDGVGSIIIFPAWALHRTMAVAPEKEGGAMWKVAAFFSGEGQ